MKVHVLPFQTCKNLFEYQMSKKGMPPDSQPLLFGFENVTFLK